MSTAERASPPVVLSAGVWHHLIQTEIISASVTGSPRLSTLLRTALALTGQRTFRGPITLDLGECLHHHPKLSQTARQVQITRITPTGEPAFLLIRLPHKPTSTPEPSALRWPVHPTGNSFPVGAAFPFALGERHERYLPRSDQ